MVLQNAHLAKPRHVGRPIIQPLLQEVQNRQKNQNEHQYCCHLNQLRDAYMQRKCRQRLLWSRK
jgi:hypothetical protein